MKEGENRGAESGKRNGIEVPQPEAWDRLHTVGKAIVSAVPFVGGPAAEILAAIIVPPLSKRLNVWRETITQRLMELEEKVDGFEIEALSHNEMFITTVMHATQVALRTHHEEKLIALRNAVVNSALEEAPAESLQLMFLNFVDVFTPWHLRILEFFNNPREWGEKNGITYPNWTMGGPSSVLEHSMPELKERREFYDQIVKDLYSRGLLNMESIHISMSVVGMFDSHTTKMGKEFLLFIASPAGIS